MQRRWISYVFLTLTFRTRPTWSASCPIMRPTKMPNLRSNVQRCSWNEWLLYLCRLDELRSRLSEEVNSGSERGVGLHVVGINSRHWPASLMISELSTLVNFTIYQSTHRDNYWSRLGGYSDDMFVYDRYITSKGCTVNQTSI